MKQHSKRLLLLLICLLICLPTVGCIRNTCEYCGESFRTGLSYSAKKYASHGLGACAYAAPCGIEGHYLLKSEARRAHQHVRCELCGDWKCTGQHGEGICMDKAPCGISGHYLLKGKTTDANGESHTACPLCGEWLCVGEHGADICISTDATLKSLTAAGDSGNDLPLAPDFSPGVFSYSCGGGKLYVGDTVTVSGIANHPSATVTGEGTVTLEKGENTVTIIVTAEDGQTKKTYTVSITAVVRPTPKKPTDEQPAPSPNEPAAPNPNEPAAPNPNESAAP